MAFLQKSSDVLYSKGDNDECYTPRYGVEPIIKYIPKEATVWLPFDTEQSNFYLMFKEQGYNVVRTHISEGYDFYKYQPERWDIIVSNPPFTNKKKIFERALSLEFPFALLMSLTWLNDSAPKQLFKERDLQLLMFNQRIRYVQPDGISMGSPTFSSGYYCSGILPKQIIMESLNIPKKGK